MRAPVSGSLPALRHRALLLLLALAVLSPVSLARTSTPWPEAGLMVDRWTTEDGLPLNHMLDVQIDPQGLVWLATLDGLVRFDGANFRVFRRSEFPELPSNRLIELAFGPDGTPWVVTARGDLARLVGDRFTVWPKPAGSLGYVHVRPAAGRVWVSGPAGLARIGPEGPETIAGFRHDEEALVVAEALGELWVGTPDGVYRVTEKPALQATRIPALMALREVSAIRPDPSGGVWVGASDGLWHTDGVAAERVVPARDGRTVCAVVWTGRLWVGDDVGWRVETDTGFEAVEGRYDACYGFSTAVDEHAWRAGAGALHRDEVALPLGVAVRNILPAPDGSVWVATDGEGLLRLRRPLVTTIGSELGSLSTVLADTSGRIWARERGGRTFTVDGEGALLPAPVPPFRRMSLPGMMVGPDTKTWFATREGVCVLDNEACRPVDPERWGDYFEDGRAMLTASDGRVWLARADGLAVGSPNAAWSLATLSEGQAVHDVAQLVEAPDGAIWAATLGQGVVRIGRDGVAQWTREGGLSSDRVRALWLDPAGVAWAGTEDAGLCRIMRGPEPPVCLGLAEGLHDDAIHSVVPGGDGRLWLSSNRGIFRLGLADLEEFAAGRSPGVVSFGLDERDGMRSREANGGASPAATVDPGGRLWFPTQAGLARIDPREILGPAPPVTFLESVRVEGAPAPLTGPLTLSPDHRELTIRWTTPEYTWPDQVRFRYRLVGVDEAWRGPTRAREAAWTSLPPGPLRFEVQANLGGTWGPLTTRMITREPGFIETRAFLVSLVVAGLALGGLGVVWQGRRARRREEELEALIAARTSALARTNSALVDQAAVLESQARTLAQQAARLAEVDALRKRLIADLAHELRTPLTLVAGPLEDLAASGAVANGPGRDTLDVVLRNTARLEALVGQLLDLARLEGGRIRLRVGRRDLGAFLRGVGERFQPECSRRRLALVFELPEAPAWVYFDTDLLDKVVSNLLGNALKFTPDGGTIRVRLELPPDEDAPARVEVEDTGIGVAETVRDRLFERFVQGDRGDARRFEGVGIGLSLARDLVSLHGGEIGVDPPRLDLPGPDPSSPTGSCFWFTLPRGVDHLGPEDLELGDIPVSPVFSRDEPREEPSEEPREEPPEEEPGLRGGEEEETGRPMVLVVEDHPEMRAFLAAHLRHRLAVTVAASGAEALELARARPPAAIVSDVMMPGMDGLELCRQLRADPALRAVPILLASAKASDEDRVAGLELADDYLTKPLRMRELVARVLKLVARGGAVPAPAPSLATGPDGTANAVNLGEAPDAVVVSGEAAPLGLADQELQRRIEARVRANLGDPTFGVEQMARALAMSRRQLLREVQRVTGESPSDLLRARRMEEGQRLLRSGAVTTVGEAALRVGLSLPYFSRTYTAWYGVNPREDLRGGR